MKIDNSFMYLDNTSALKNSKNSYDPERLMEVCREFEGIFLNMMLKQMRRTVPDGGIQKSFTRNLYESLHDEELAKHMAKSGGIGLAQELYRQLSKTTKTTKNLIE